MQVTTTTFTVAEYCSQMQSKAILINRNYQRTSAVWPSAAKSYLLESILLGYPIPKICLYQKTDAKSRKTVKEIVDGQQRSATIFSFYNDEFKITGKGKFSGKLYSSLDESEQGAFLNYILGVDLFVGATDHEIREVFRRMNSYTVPLNYQEKRHATNQGDFKWLIVDLCEKYSDQLKLMGVFGERQFARMSDGELLSEYFLGMQSGIQSASQAKLNALYKSYENDTTPLDQWRDNLSKNFQILSAWESLHNTAIMKPYHFLILLMALSHVRVNADSLNEASDKGGRGIDNVNAEQRLSQLANAVEEKDFDSEYYRSFVEASSKATNRINQRKVRFKYLCNAIANQ